VVVAWRHVVARETAHPIRGGPCALVGYLDLVEIGLGVAVFPEAIAAPRGARLREIAISGRRWDWTVRAEALAPGPSNPAARALWTMLADQEQALTGA
jgi:hypothetical protein